MECLLPRRGSPLRRPSCLRALFFAALAVAVFNCSDKKVAGTADDASAGTILGELLTDGAKIRDTVKVSLYEDDGKLTKKQAGAKPPLKNLIAAYGTYEFDSLSPGAYRIEVTRGGIVVGGSGGIVLGRNEHKVVNITIIVIINQTFNIWIDESKTVNNFYISNGVIVKTDSGYVLTFAATDTPAFQMVIKGKDDTSVVSVQTVRKEDGAIVFEVPDSAARVTVTPGPVVSVACAAAIAIDDSQTDIRDGDTTARDSLRFTLVDTDASLRTGFRWALDAATWSAWEGRGEKRTTFVIRALKPGKHALSIQALCAGSDASVDSAIGFFIAAKPAVVASVDSTIKADAGASCTLWVAAEGTGPLTFAWYRGGQPIDQSDNDTLLLTAVSSQNAGSYVCGIKSAWGETASGTIGLAVAGRFTVIYNGNGHTGGTVPVDGRVYRKGDTLRVSENSGGLVKIGHSFSGWSRLADGGGATCPPGSLVTVDSVNVTLFANWVVDTLTMTFDSRGGSAVPARRITFGGLAAAPDNPGKPGHTFTGWTTDTSGLELWVFSRDTVSVDVALYANWSGNPTYTLTYSGNGGDSGSVPSGPLAYESGATVKVLGNTGSLSRTGYVFSGWNTAPDGSGSGYAAGSTFTVPAMDDTLYAQWTPNRYTVTYFGNGNEAGDPPGQGTYACGATVIIPGRGTMSKTGYTLIGWNTAADGGGTLYPVDTSFVKGAGNDTLYAQWRKIGVSVTYIGNGHTAGSPPAAAMYDYGTSVTIAAQGGMEKTGHTFVCWNLSPDGSGQDLQPGSSMIVSSANVTVYAKWIVNRYTITYSGNNQTSGNPPPQDTVAFGAGRTLPVQGSLLKTAHYYRGWNTAADGAGTRYAAGGTYVMGAGNAVLYAEWEIYHYTVTFNSQGGSAVTAQTVNHGGRAAEPAAPTFAGYTLRGWFKEAECVNRWNFAADSVTKNMTLFAKWAVVDGDGNEYTTVTIGNQVWTAQNWKTTRFRDGAAIPPVADSLEWITLASPGYCWYANDSTNKNIYGGLYNWHAVAAVKFAPQGWHVPSKAEWDTLVNYLGGKTVAGGKLKTTGMTYWLSPNEGATNEAGFAARGGSGRRNDGWFFPLRSYADWWTVSELSADSSAAIQINWNGTAIIEPHLHKRYGIGVRFVRD